MIIDYKATIVINAKVASVFFRAGLCSIKYVVVKTLIEKKHSNA